MVYVIPVPRKPYQQLNEGILMRYRMKKLFSTEFKSLFTSIKLYISITIGAALFLHPLFSYVKSWSVLSPVELLSYPLATSDFTPFAALFCVLPYADSFCKDYNSGYYRFILYRVSATKYAMMKCFVAAISGAFVMAINMSLAVLLSNICAGEIDTVDRVAFMQHTVWGKNGIILLYDGIIYYAIRIFIAAMFGSVWALVGLLTAVVIVNKYVTMIVPFVIYQFLWYIMSEKAINPVYLLRADFARIPSLSFVIIYQMAWIIILGVASYRCIKKRVIV